MLVRDLTDCYYYYYFYKMIGLMLIGYITVKMTIDFHIWEDMVLLHHCTLMFTGNRIYVITIL